MIPTTTGSNVCFGSSTNLEVSVTGGLAPYSYLWDNAATGSSQTVSPTGLTTYSVTITDSLGCLAFDTITIAVTTAITVTDSAATICEGDAITIYTQVTGGSGVRAYLWDNGSTTSSISVSPTINTTYSVTVTDTCGSASATIDITTIEPPFVDFSMGCDPNPYGLQFINNSDPLTGSTFTWDFGDAASSTDQDPSHDYVSTGTYPIQLTVTTVDGCTNDTTIMATAPPDAAFIANPSEASTDDPEVQFTDWSVDPNNIVYWEWDFGDSTGVDNLLGQAGNDNVPSDTATGGTFQNPSHNYSDTGLFIVQLTVHDANGCIDTITQEIRIFGEYFLYAPSAFTPNFDGSNDVFLPTGIGIMERDYEFAVYNRWGDRIFESDDINVGWNGTANGGGVVQSDVYIWTLSTRDVSLKIHQYIGHVTLYR
jgi:gliding motility-associated-like protein